jgi:beta-phosphoglucomutase-like phosphatase (HAD superfamily)
LQLDSLELIAFEDAQFGVKAAKSAGMMSVGIAQPDRTSAPLDAGADLVVADFRCLSYSRLESLLTCLIVGV